MTPGSVGRKMEENGGNWDCIALFPDKFRAKFFYVLAAFVVWP